MQGGYIRQERPYVTFAALFVSEKREKKKSYFMFLYGGSKPYPVSATPTAFACANRSIPALRTKSKYSQQTKQKIKVHSAFSFDEEGAKEKATKKKTPE